MQPYRQVISVKMIYSVSPVQATIPVFFTIWICLDLYVYVYNSKNLLPYYTLVLLSVQYGILLSRNILHGN